MKKIIFCLACFLIFTNHTGVFALESEESEILNLESSNLKYDLGSIEKNKTVKKTLIVINKLNETLEIQDVRSTCDCIKITTIDNKPIKVKRGGIFELEITFDSTGVNQDVQEAVYIMTANMNYQLIRLDISAEIVSPE